jgi:FkbM family methyltransferase
MEKLGTSYGGWFIPKSPLLNSNSIVYSVGVGEDISFDALLQTKYDCNLILIDPTKKAIKHFDEFKLYVNNKDKFKFSGGIQNDYYSHLKNSNVNLTKINYLNIGLYDEKTTLKFYKQDNPNYVSQSFNKNMFGKTYDIIKTDTLKNIMTDNNHKEIDLLKMDIEGAEIKVLNHMIESKIFPKYLLVEFDLFLKKKDKTNETDKIIKKLKYNNYKILKNDNYNITFERIN